MFQLPLRVLKYSISNEFILSAWQYSAVLYRKRDPSHRNKQRYIEKYAVTLNYNGKYTVTPIVTVIIVTVVFSVTKKATFTVTG